MDTLTESASHISISQQDPSIKLPACPKSFLNIEYEEADQDVSPEHCNLPSSCGPCVTGTVLNCNLLTVPGQDRDVKDYFQLDIACGAFAYNVGDTVGVLCRNVPEEVELVKMALEEGYHWTKPCKVTLKNDPQSKPKSKIPPHLPSNLTTLANLFSTTLDIRTIPKKLFLRALVEFTEDPKDKQLLSLLCSKEGASEYTRQVLEARLSFVDLLALVPSCRPPESLLLEHLPRLLPRPYSISSSCKASPGSVSWIFTKVTDPKPGLATTWMSSLASGDTITFYPRIGNSFCPPSDPNTDFIMIAAGSGIGPFVGFLKDRKMRIESGETLTGKCWLFFGCRYSDSDFLCKEFLQDMQQTGVLTRLSTSFSRETGPKYVQHRIEAEKEEFLRWLTTNKAMIYVCGDAKGMASGVRETVQKILKEYLGESEGANFITEMISNKMYKEDIWA